MKRLAIVLAAGRGTRLRPLTDDRPKCLIDVGGRTILERLLGELEGWADRVIIVSGHAHAVLGDYIDDMGGPHDVLMEHNDRYLETNSLASAAVTMPYWTEAGEILISNSDVVFGRNALRPVLDADGTCVAAVVRKPWDAEDMKVEVDVGSGLVRAISKEIPPERSYGEFTGFVKIGRTGIAPFADTIEAMLREPDMVERAWYDLAIDRLAQQSEMVTFKAIPEEHYAEIDTLTDLEAVRRRFGTMPHPRSVSG